MFRFSSKKDKKNISWFKGQGSVNLLLDENIGLMKIQKPDVKVNNDSQGKVVLNWNSIAEADTFEVYVSAAKDGPYKLLKSTMYKRLTHSSANRGEVYWYKVRACNTLYPELTSDFSEAILGRDKSRIVSPLLSIKRNDKGKVVIFWDNVQGAGKYQVYICQEPEGEYKLLLETSYREMTHNSAVSGRDYSYKVRAVDKTDTAETSEFSNIVKSTEI